MNEIMNISGVDCYEKDGTAYLKLETVARGLGFTTIAKSGNEAIRWNTVYGYLQDLGVATSCNGTSYQEKCPDFIPENIFYRLAMKAKNETAERFQALVADEIIPSIRRQNKSKEGIQMNELQIFNYNGNEVRTIQKDGEPWWVLKDVCEILNIDNHKDLPKRLEDDEVGRFDLPHPQSKTKTLEMICVNESGLYNVILRSDKPEAKPFRKWVTSEVLPSIRKHGGYLTPQKIEEILLNPDTIIKLATDLKAEQEKREALESKVEQDKPLVAFANSVSVASTSILVGELAKLLKQNGMDMGQNRLFAWMRENGFLISRRGSDYNMPTQRSMDKGLFEIKETVISHGDGHTSINKTPKVTGKGQIYFINLFLEKAV